MGRDKALIEVEGRPLAVRVADALLVGGCHEVLAVGGDGAALAQEGLTPVEDRWPGEGPLGGLATALGAAAARAPHGVTMVLAPCDLIAPRSDVVASLLTALDREGDADAAVPLVGRRLEWIHSAWRTRPALVARVEALVRSGARRLDAVAEVICWTEVTITRPHALADADIPSDLPPDSGAW